jgi:hypothetical protein
MEYSSISSIPTGTFRLFHRQDFIRRFPAVVSEYEAWCGALFFSPGSRSIQQRNPQKWGQTQIYPLVI